MATSPIALDEFGTLDLISDPLSVGAARAVDLLNVDFDKLGAVRSRDGSETWTTVDAASAYFALYSTPVGAVGGVPVLVAVRNSGTSVAVDKINESSGVGSVTAAGSFTAANTPFTCSFTTLGTSTASFVYIAFRNARTASAETVRKYDGSVTLGSGVGKPTFVGTWVTSNRLVQGSYRVAADSPSGANGSESTVFFSDPGAPDTYGANNFVTLRPGDGENITGILGWRDFVFVAKQSSIFVFHSESLDAAGNPIFNFRRIDLPPHAFMHDKVNQGSYQQSMTVGPDGVYLSTTAGVYLTTGGDAMPVSPSLAPIFGNDPAISDSVRALHTPNIVAVGRRLVLSYITVNSSKRQLIGDLDTGRWSIWSLPIRDVLLGGMASPYLYGFSDVNQENRIYFPQSNGLRICRTRRTLTDDSGVSFSWLWKSGLYDLGGPLRKNIAWTDLTGSGTATLKINTQDAAPGNVADTGTSVTLGTAPALATARRRRAVSGRFFQHELSGTGAARVSRVAHYVGQGRLA